MAKPTRGVRLIAAILAALGALIFVVFPVLIVVLIVASPVLFPGLFFWIGRITIAAGNATFNTRLFWIEGAAWECLMIVILVNSPGDPAHLTVIVILLACPMLSLVLSLPVAFWLPPTQPTEIQDTVKEDLQRYLDVTISDAQLPGRS